MFALRMRQRLHAAPAWGRRALALYGTRDKLVSPASERNYTSVPGAQVVAIPGAGHSPMVEKPYATSNLILAFAARTLAHSPVHPLPSGVRNAR